MMDTNSGVVKISKAGSYFLTFFADMYSVSGEYTFAYLKRENAIGVETLAAIKNAADLDDEGGLTVSVDDYSSNSMTVIADLKAGDELYVSARTDGLSHFYSNDDRKIAFSGFLLD